MGIPGLYSIIGNGERTSLASLSLKYRQTHGRLFRIAIDISIWMYQVRAGQGGASPALRTLYYRLNRLLCLCINPVFVFDGFAKPLKRNQKASTGQGDTRFINKIKRLLDLFGFPHIEAPGEAEAECALLQMQGSVDAVLSEDVDTLMFGCELLLRSMHSEGSNKAASHVSLHDSTTIKLKHGLDREGMILVALMSGGDYLPAGIPRCGVKVACEAARGGFGSDLCGLADDDIVGMNEWRERLRYELRTNESGFFRTKHKALMIPDRFPDCNILRDYKSPARSSEADIGALSKRLEWGASPDIQKLRVFVAQEFNWKGISGAKHYIRSLAPGLLTQRLTSACFNRSRPAEHHPGGLVSVSGIRKHFDSGGTPECRLSYIPADVVQIDLNVESESANEGCSLVPESYDQQDLDTLVTDKGEQGGTSTRNSHYDPRKIAHSWVPEDVIKDSVPKLWDGWNVQLVEKESSQAKSKNKAQKPRTNVAIESYFKTSKVNAAKRNHLEQPGLIRTTDVAYVSNIPPPYTEKSQVGLKQELITSWTTEASSRRKTNAAVSITDKPINTTDSRVQSPLKLDNSIVKTATTHKEVRQPHDDTLEYQDHNNKSSTLNSSLPKQDHKFRGRSTKSELGRSYTTPMTSSSNKVTELVVLTDAEDNTLSPSLSQQETTCPIVASKQVEDRKTSLHRDIGTRRTLTSKSKGTPQARETKKALLRESVEGCWRPYHSEDETISHNPINRFTDVEVLDLTRS